MAGQCGELESRLSGLSWATSEGLSQLLWHGCGLFCDYSPAHPLLLPHPASQGGCRVYFPMIPLHTISSLRLLPGKSDLRQLPDVLGRGIPGKQQGREEFWNVRGRKCNDNHPQ